MQLNFSRNKKVFCRLNNVAIDRETKESIFLSGNPIIHFHNGTGKKEPPRECKSPERCFDYELPIKYKERINKLLDMNPQEPVLFEL